MKFAALIIDMTKDRAKSITLALIDDDRWFQVEPVGDDFVQLTVKDEPGIHQLIANVVNAETP